MHKTSLTLALLTVVVGLAGVSQAQAGAGTYQLGSSAFQDRCEANGGDVMRADQGYDCDLGMVLIECKFIGVDTTCEWDGAQNMRPVSRVLGAAVAESLVDPGAAGGGKKKKLIWNPDLPIKL